MSSTKSLCESVVSGFGYGKNGQLGESGQNYSPSPIQISIPESIFSVSAGEGHCMILTDSFKVYVFGRNIYGQLGLGHTNAVYEPVLLAGLANIEQICCGAEHSVALS
jgi:alpha-tubulin suppressor-like RCC1 family protein